MAVLTDPERQTVTNNCAKSWSNRRKPAGMTKADLFTMIGEMDDAFDVWVPTLIAAISEPGASLNNARKLEAFFFILGERYDVNVQPVNGG